MTQKALGADVFSAHLLLPPLDSPTSGDHLQMLLRPLIPAGGKNTSDERTTLLNWRT